MSAAETRFRQAEAALWASVGAQPTERVVRLPHLDTDLRVQELGEGPPVVLVHGASNGGTSWAALAARLLGFRSILVDRPGCGLSPRAAARFRDTSDLEAFADALVVDALDALELPSAHLVATSYGGYIGLRTAAAHPDRIDRLVLPGWPMGAPIEETPLVMRIATLPFLGRLAMAIPPSNRMVRSMLAQVGLRGALESGRFGPVEVAWYRSLLRDTSTMRNELAAGPRLITMRGMNRAILHPPELLASIEVPTLFLWGDDDPLGGEAVARPFAAQIPGAELEVLPGVGHAPWIDEPDVVARTIADFLGAG